MAILDQYANAIPPRKGACIALAVDATGRAYSLASLTLSGFKPESANTRSSYVYLQLEADGDAIYVQFASDDTVTLSDTAKTTAGTAITMESTYCMKIPAGGVVPVRLDRKLDKYIHVKCASGGSSVLRANAFSEAL